MSNHPIVTVNLNSGTFHARLGGKVSAILKGDRSAMYEVELLDHPTLKKAYVRRSQMVIPHQEEAATLTPELVEAIKERLKELLDQPIECSECGRPFYWLQWTDRPTFKTEGIMFLLSDQEVEEVSIANMKDKLTCSVHNKYEGGPAQ
jgi:hypothetical protein